LAEKGYKMLEIQKAVVEDHIPQIKFACDISACKGACCTLPGGLGAPLLDVELEQLKHSFPVIKSYLPLDHLDAINEFGLYEGEPGSYTTMCFHHRACVFVLYENGIARCAFEKAFNEGRLEWRKPLSCHLFPIRIDRGVTHRLRYEHISECNPALDRGNQENIFLGNFLKEPLVRAFSSSWYDDFQLTCEWERKHGETK
jgi:hypothetical protein